MVLKKIAAFLLAAVMSVTFSALAFAQEYNDPEVELIAEFENEVYDADEAPQFTAAFGTHTRMPEGTSAKLSLECEGCTLLTSGVYGYSTIALDKYVCKSSSNGGFYPNYGENVRLTADANKGSIAIHLDIKDSSDNVIHQEDLKVWFIKRDGMIALSDLGFDDCEQKLDKPLYKAMVFLKTPLGTVVKIIAFVALASLMYCGLHYKDIRNKIRARKAVKAEKQAGKGGKENG